MLPQDDIHHDYVTTIDNDGGQYLTCSRNVLIRPPNIVFILPIAQLRRYFHFGAWTTSSNVILSSA